jgi:uncharacterized damage-inducible protein DinB
LEIAMPCPILHCRDDVLRMLDELTEGRRDMLAACEKLSPAQRTDPVVPGSWSVLKNLTHLAWAEAFMLAWIKKRPAVLPKEEFPPEPAEDLAAIRTAFDEAHAEAIAFLKANPEAVLTEACRYGFNARAETVGGIFFHLVEHEIGHRAMVRFKLLRLTGG